MMKKRKDQQIVDYVFNFKPGNSFFHKLHPVSKIFFTVFLTFVVLIQSSLLVLAGFFLMIVGISLSVGISLKLLLSRLRWIIMIVILTVVINIIFNVIYSPLKFFIQSVFLFRYLIYCISFYHK